MLDSGCKFIYSTSVQKLKTENISFAVQASLRGKGNGRKNWLKSLTGSEASFLFHNYKMQFAFFSLSFLKDEK